LTIKGREWKIRGDIASSQTVSDIQRVHMPSSSRNTDKSHVRDGSVLFEKIIPFLLVLMGVVTLLLILFAAGVLLGIIHF
jgi:hypothetical protein